MRVENHNYAVSGALVQGLASAGLTDVVICPGSRSGPLAVSFARSELVESWIHLDERSAGFFALGIAKGSGRPVAVVTSSGTAAANLLPAAVEANLTNVPLIFLTADRPPELIDWGANQAIRQSGIYGAHVKWAADLPVPQADLQLVDYALSMGKRAYVTAAGHPSGPVHLNVPFREPLSPVVVPGEEAQIAQRRELLEGLVTTAAPDGWDAGRGLRNKIRRLERGLIVCGPQTNPQLADAVSEVARVLAYPILADPLSQVRIGPHDRSHVIDHYDLFLRDEGLWERLEPETVIRFGAWPTSKTLGAFLARSTEARHVLVAESGWPDPHQLADDVVQTDACSFCRGLSSEAGGGGVGGPWLDTWVSLNGSAGHGVAKYMADREEMFEGKVFWEVLPCMPEGAILFAGNSMPVRDMDAFLPSCTLDITVMGNRGASGIDGSVSTALGAGVGAGRPVVAVLGDLTFLHDLTGLLMARTSRVNATIIVINNDGGGIFSFLPQAEHPEHFEEVYGTPHGLTFEAAAAMYGLKHSRAETWPQFEGAMRASVQAEGVSIIEVPGSRERNVDLHREAWAAAAEALHGAARS